MTIAEMLSIAAQDLAQPVLIAGPTASGKSALALRLAQDQNRNVVNADAIQVFENWRVLTARPSDADETAAPHLLYGHVRGNQPYSVGDWLREVEPLLSQNPAPVIVGGTGLYFAALTQGLADIPATPQRVRDAAQNRLNQGELQTMVHELDAATRARIDTANPMRVQRAWEVLQSTGAGLAHWQDATPPPVLPVTNAHPFVLDAPKEWLTPRIEQRFAAMLAEGALDEAAANLDTWDPTQASSKAIGAAELIAVVEGTMAIETAKQRAETATRQYAKRQRTWFRARMQGWRRIFAHEL